MDTPDLNPPVPKKLLIALDQAFPDNHHDLVKKVMKGELDSNELFFDAGVRSVIRLLQSWHNDHSSLEN